MRPGSISGPRSTNRHGARFFQAPVRVHAKARSALAPPRLLNSDDIIVFTLADCSSEVDLALEDNLLWYVVWRSADYELPPTKTRLVKYLYLVDLLASRARRQRMTGLQWIYYDYGPYCVGFEDLLQNEAHRRHLRLERLPSRAGFSGEPTVVQPLQQPAPQLVPAEFRTLADRVCSTWRDWELNVLLNYIYFETPPMRHAERGAELDLLVELDEPWPPRHKPLTPPFISSDVRERLAELHRSRASSSRSRSRPPVWDEQYLSLVRETSESDEWLLGIRGLLHTPDEPST